MAIYPRSAGNPYRTRRYLDSKMRFETSDGESNKASGFTIPVIHIFMERPIDSLDSPFHRPPIITIRVANVRVLGGHRAPATLPSARSLMLRLPSTSHRTRVVSTGRLPIRFSYSLSAKRSFLQEALRPYVSVQRIRGRLGDPRSLLRALLCISVPRTSMSSTCVRLRDYRRMSPWTGSLIDMSVPMRPHQRIGFFLAL